MNNPDIEVEIGFTENGRLIEEETDPVIMAYHKFDKEYYLSIDNAICSSKTDKSDAYMRAQLKSRRIAKEIKSSLSQFGYNDIEITDILVKYLYGIKKSANKTALWICYGDIILDNLMKNKKKSTKDIQCIDCGKWFEVSVFDSATCRCHECAAEHKRNLARIRKQKQRNKENN